MLRFYSLYAVAIYAHASIPCFLQNARKGRMPQAFRQKRPFEKMEFRGIEINPREIIENEPMKPSAHFCGIFN
jgi:hypothetical protein